MAHIDPSRQVGIVALHGELIYWTKREQILNSVTNFESRTDASSHAMVGAHHHIYEQEYMYCTVLQNERSMIEEQTFSST